MAHVRATPEGRVKGDLSYQIITSIFPPNHAAVVRRGNISHARRIYPKSQKIFCRHHTNALLLNQDRSLNYGGQPPHTPPTPPPLISRESVSCLGRNDYFVGPLTYHGSFPMARINAIAAPRTIMITKIKQPHFPHVMRVCFPRSRLYHSTIPISIGRHYQPYREKNAGGRRSA